MTIMDNYINNEKWLYNWMDNIKITKSWKL